MITSKEGIFSYISPEKRVPADHPLRPIRKMVDEILKEMSPKFQKLYSDVGRPSIAPEPAVAVVAVADLLFGTQRTNADQQLQYNLLFRWFVGMEMDEAVWNHAGVQQESGAFAERGDRGGVFPTGAGTCEAAHVGMNISRWTGL